MLVGRVRRGNYIFVAWKGDHGPRHVHVYKDSKLVVKWDLEKKHSLAVLNGEVVARRTIEKVPFGGVSYLRLRSTATGTDTAGVLIESLRADIKHPLRREK